MIDRKKILSLLLSGLLLLSMLTACSGEEINEATETAQEIAGLVEEEEEEPAEESETAEEADTTQTENADGQEVYMDADPAEDLSDGDADESSETSGEITYYFRNDDLLEQHYEKHGIDMGFASATEYEAAASAVINNPDALTKTEAEDGDYVYYVEETNEFVVLSTDGYIRTYFYPDAGIDYYNRQ